ncbi:adenine deaminase C-terminal domain-containing protein [Peribacillus sp. NPDC096622]|uniref:adenine deaminase C-terminal domain-containing protein n=1 Tax=Peribacillus sp. NPDC096622 TaxID=3364396 RepID=UPI0038214585
MHPNLNCPVNVRHQTMSLSTLSLPVSPALKITDHGLINVNEGKTVPLIMSDEA